MSALLSGKLHRTYGSSDVQPNSQGDGFKSPTVLDGLELGAVVPATPPPTLSALPLVIIVVHPPVGSTPAGFPEEMSASFCLSLESLAHPNTAQATVLGQMGVQRTLSRMPRGPGSVTGR